MSPPAASAAVWTAAERAADDLPELVRALEGGELPDPGWEDLVRPLVVAPVAANGTEPDREA